MARPRALTPEQEAEAIALSATHSNREILRVFQERGVPVGYSTIAALVVGERKERSEITREVARERLRQHVLGDLDLLQATRDQLNCWRLGFEEDGKTPLDPPLRITQKLLVIDRLNRIVDSRLRAGGVTDDDKTVQVVFARTEDDDPE